MRELEQHFGARRAIPFYCSVDPDLYRPTAGRDAFRCDLSYLGTYAPDRQPKLMRLLDEATALLPEGNFLVAGPQYPEEIVWRPNVRRMIHVSPPDHPAFYSSSRFTLNLTRDDTVAAGYSPSVRLFEASACGAVILSDAWPGLEEFLTPGEEILLPADADEVANIIEHMSDAERKRIGEHARDRILAEHTADPPGGGIRTDRGRVQAELGLHGYKLGQRMEAQVWVFRLQLLITVNAGCDCDDIQTV